MRRDLFEGKEVSRRKRSSSRHHHRHSSGYRRPGALEILRSAMLPARLRPSSLIVLGLCPKYTGSGTVNVKFFLD